MQLRAWRALEEYLPGTPLRTLIGLAAAIAVASAWFNEGFFSHDEHFQILEFAWYKLGRTPADALAWEFHARIRPAIQPWLAAGLFRGLDALGWFTPLFAAFGLRLVSGLLGLWVTLEICIRAAPWIRDAALRRLLLAGSLFLWFLPYAHGRFASENWGGLLFFGGLCLLLDARDPAGSRHRMLQGALAGFLWGAAFFCRFQVGLAIAGAGLWLVVIDRAPRDVLASLAAAFVLACAVNLALDHWLYGAWVCTPCNYFYVNVVQGKAASFGTEPWWFYLAQLLAVLVPPFSLLLIALLGCSLWWCRRNVLVWAVVPFVLGHSLLGHKETRFLIPMTYGLVPLLALGADRAPAAIRAAIGAGFGRRSARAGAGLFVALNLAALAVMTVKPSSETAAVYRRIYDESRTGPIVLFTTSLLPYSMAGNAVNFYRPGNLTVSTLRDISGLRAGMAAGSGRFLLFQQSLRPSAWLAAQPITCTPVARTLPLWTERININNWTSRMYRWSVYSVTAAARTGGC